MIRFERQQRSVGHGGFHSGLVQPRHSSPFRYVYDCGSTNHRRLRDEISSFTSELEENTLEALFVSHFHSDHVFGLDQLFAECRVKTAIIPYISPIQQMCLIARRSEARPPTVSDVQFIVDPVNWMTQRGVERVIVVTNGDDRPPFYGNHIPPSDPSDKVFSTENMLSKNPDFDVKKLRNYGDSNRSPWSTSPNAKASSVFLLNHAYPLSLMFEQQVIWEFMTFVQQEGNQIEQFRDRFSEGFPNFDLDGQHDRIDAVLTLLRSSRSRKKLTDIYRTVFVDLNITSMSLYSGPAARTTGMSRSEVFWGGGRAFNPWISRRNMQVGWILTGDADLKTDSRRQQFVEHYFLYLPKTRLMSLPHHGSRHNFDSELTEYGIEVFSATGRAGSKKHPHPEVIESVRRRGVLCTTDENSNTVLQDRGWVSPPA